MDKNIPKRLFSDEYMASDEVGPVIFTETAKREPIDWDAPRPPITLKEYHDKRFK